jgi:Fe-S oxidoreductase
MARFKSEYLAAQWEQHGAPLRARVLGHADTLGRWGSRMAPFSNWVAGSALARWVNERLLRIDARRPAPRFARTTWESRMRGRGNHGAVTFFNDTFTNFYTPETGMAAVEVLEAAGITSSLAPNVCCGRPLISQGLLGEARELARQNTERLYSLAGSGKPLLFCEPSCLSAIKEDAPDLLRGDEQRKARALAAVAMLWEEYVEREWSAGRMDLELQSGPAEILLHGHCHQKAMGLQAPAQALLARLPGSKLTVLDAGCCGMAGSFGYTREHYEVSRTIAERKLLPAARALDGAVLVAAGTSCRHQVHDLARVTAVHPAVLLQTLLEEN